MSKDSDEGWDRFPETKFRMREDGLKTILDGLGYDGFCLSGIPRIQLIDEGVYIEMLLNVGKHGSVVALPLEVLIPVPAKLLVKKPVKEKKKKGEVKPPEPVVEPTAVVVPPPEPAEEPEIDPDVHKADNPD